MTARYPLVLDGTSIEELQVGDTLAGAGDVTGPASSTANAVPTFSDTSGKVIQDNSGVTISAGVVTATGFSGPLNGTVGASTPAAVTGTTITANTGFSGPLDGTVGATTPTTGVFTQVDITAQGDLRLQDTTGGQYVALQAPGTVASSYTLTMPAADGTNGQVLTTDGSGALTFTTPSSGISAGKSIALAMIFGF